MYTAPIFDELWKIMNTELMSPKKYQAPNGSYAPKTTKNLGA